MAAEQELPLFLGLTDKSIVDIPKAVEKQRYMTSVAPKAGNPGKWVEMPRLPIPTGEHAVIDEVTNLVEDPVAILGSFDTSYLDLPADILTTVMKKHQRYLPVRTGR